MPKTSVQAGQETLDPLPNDKVQIDKENLLVKTAIKLLEDNFSDKKKQDDKNEKVIKVAEEAFDAEEPEGVKKTTSKKFIQAFWKFMSRTKPLDYSIHGVGATRTMEMLVHQGIETVFRRGGFYKTLMGKGGVTGNAGAIGDGFMLFSTKEKGFPFKFTPIPNNNVYLDVNATGMRTGAKPVRKCAVIIPRTIAEFNRLYPDYADKAGAGQIPKSINLLKDLDQTNIQRMEEDWTQMIEVCHYFDLDNEAYGIFAGSGCTLIKEDMEDDYPFQFTNQETQEDEAYIPVFHFMGIPAFTGFYNHGIFHWLYDYAVFSRQLFNKVSSVVSDNADPTQVFSVPMGQGAAVFKQINQARQARAKGKQPVMALEYDPSNPGGSAVSLNTLRVQADIGAVQFVDQYLDRDIKRMGIHLDELDTAGNITATQILSEEENANMFVRQMQEYNAPEFEFILNVMIDLIPKTVTPDRTTAVRKPDGELDITDVKRGDKTPIYLTTTIKVNGRSLDMKSATLGALAEEMKKVQYFPKVNSRSGAIASKMRAAQVRRGLEIAAPGSPAQLSLIGEFSHLNDLDLEGQDFIPQQQAPAPAIDEVPQAEAAATERQSINPRVAEQEPVI
ncbi:hypothetical protein HN682_08050 [Candidatus Peregrinibacteria bacterium]|jgi:hypothetical protein|nr:hypothetical protein [Candidatus Peregrinibacteria bacterium]